MVYFSALQRFVLTGRILDMKRKRIFLFSLLLALAIFIAKPSHASYSYYEEDGADSQTSTDEIIDQEEMQYIQTEGIEQQFNFAKNAEIDLTNEEIIERLNEENERLSSLSNQMDLPIQVSENDSESDLEVSENAFLNDPDANSLISRSPAIKNEENTPEDIDAISLKEAGLEKESEKEEVNQNSQKKQRSR